MSLIADSIDTITREPGKLIIQPRAEHPLASVILFTRADGSVRDIEYVQRGNRTGVNLTSRASLPGWVQNPNTLINNGIAGTLNNQLFLLYHTPTETSVYADERGLFFNGNNQSGDSWTLVIDTNNLQTNVDYPCNATTHITLEVVGSDKYSSANGGQCRIQLTTIELLADKRIDYIDGIFVAELPGSDRRQAPQVVDGRFRFDVN
ncbi:hypothetical protein [Cellvibrio polysaccharolyticus]|uniref:Uncharacterized protein n=1 Tax=Cellvibrio polysaccharolyticus TaxID=2082724 RepID=A0A928V113_9GAMM|nr:hypothetical protein [Cellvibrio polysaccharolyticus]MBE8716815.1 hypothetical protein [Cellvibrio polysaccharolyticus]